jgi:hypothetical protein
MSNAKKCPGKIRKEDIGSSSPDATAFEELQQKTKLLKAVLEPQAESSDIGIDIDQSPEDLFSLKVEGSAIMSELEEGKPLYKRLEEMVTDALENEQLICFDTLMEIAEPYLVCPGQPIGCDQPCNHGDFASFNYSYLRRICFGALFPLYQIIMVCMTLFGLHSNAENFVWYPHVTECFKDCVDETQCVCGFIFDLCKRQTQCNDMPVNAIVGLAAYDKLVEAALKVFKVNGHKASLMCDFCTAAIFGPQTAYSWTKSGGMQSQSRARTAKKRPGNPRLSSKGHMISARQLIFEERSGIEATERRTAAKAAKAVKTQHDEDSDYDDESRTESPSLSISEGGQSTTREIERLRARSLDSIYHFHLGNRSPKRPLSTISDITGSSSWIPDDAFQAQCEALLDSVINDAEGADLITPDPAEKVCVAPNQSVSRRAPLGMHSLQSPGRDRSSRAAKNAEVGKSPDAVAGLSSPTRPLESPVHFGHGTNTPQSDSCCYLQTPTGKRGRYIGTGAENYDFGHGEASNCGFFDTDGYNPLEIVFCASVNRNRLDEDQS